MHPIIFHILAFTVFFSCSLARNLRLLKQSSNAIANRSVDPVEMKKGGDTTKYVFMHHVSSVQ